MQHARVAERFTQACQAKSMSFSRAEKIIAKLLPGFEEILLGTDLDPVCPCCGAGFELDLLEIWEARDFVFSACCEQIQGLAIQHCAADGRDAAAFLRLLDVEGYCGGQLRSVASNEYTGQFLLDWRLRLVDIEQRDAKDFVNAYHEHLDAPPGWRFGKAVINGQTVVGVIWVGRAVARSYNKDTVTEVNRCAVRRDIPAALRRNACSMLYGWASREAEKRGFSDIITYTLAEEETGVTLKAAGWECEGEAGGGSWNSPSRPRVDKGPTVLKVRWRKRLKPRKARPPRVAAPAPLPFAAPEFEGLFCV